MRTDLAWPPPYKLKRSKRAKYVSITIHPSEGLRVTIPFKAKEHEALIFLNKQRRWIEKHSDLLKPENIELEQKRYQLPQQIELRALNQQWVVRFRYLSDSKRVLLHFFENRLIFSGKVDNFKCCVPLLKPWLKKLAQNHLVDWINRVAEDCQLNFNRVAFRGQKTLWGSCSPQHNISLNYKLLFLPPALVNYVIIHELCHTVHLNHSKHFWAKVAKFDPDFKQHERELRKADKFIPPWYE